MNPPPNPHAKAARSAMREAIRPLLVNPPQFEYYLTWPAAQPAVCCVAGQWRRNEAGDIEAWYTASQLREVLAAMQAATVAAEGTAER